MKDWFIFSVTHFLQPIEIIRFSQCSQQHYQICKQIMTKSETKLCHYTTSFFAYLSWYIILDIPCFSHIFDIVTVFVMCGESHFDATDKVINLGYGNLCLYR